MVQQVRWLGKCLTEPGYTIEVELSSCESCTESEYELVQDLSDTVNIKILIHHFCYIKHPEQVLNTFGGLSLDAFNV